MTAPHAAPPVALPALAVTIAPATESDLPYCLGSWSESHKLTPGHQRMPWGLYKQHAVPELRSKLAASTVLVAHAGGELVGWLAMSRGRRVHACHWVHTRYRVGQDGEPLRRRGVMTALLAAADLGSRFIYTHRGPLPRHGKGKTTSDEWITRKLAERGVFATFVPYQEWIR